MTRRPLRPARFAAPLAILALCAFAATASASQISLKCAGKGPHNKDSSGTVLCAEPGKSRLLTGSLRNDSGKPVAGKVAVTISNWIPTGQGAFNIVAGKPVTIAADAAGKFSFSVRTATKVSVEFEALGDEALGLSPAAAQADVSRQLVGKVKKLGGGRVKITVKGTTHPLRIAVVNESGYEVPGGKLRKASKRGSAVFDLGSAHGKFSYYVDAGELSDLFWFGAPPSFRL